MVVTDSAPSQEIEVHAFGSFSTEWANCGRPSAAHKSPRSRSLLAQNYRCGRACEARRSLRRRRGRRPSHAGTSGAGAETLGKRRCRTAAGTSARAAHVSRRVQSCRWRGHTRRQRCRSSCPRKVFGRPAASSSVEPPAVARSLWPRCRASCRSASSRRR